MLASTWFDLVIGLDLHFEMVPTPAPTPIPFPHPFVGLVFSPAGLALNLAISNAIGMALGGSFKGPVLINGVPATNTGTEAVNKLVLPHFVIPPGTAWTPMPKAPKPPTRPGVTPMPDSPVAPAGDAVIITGSKTVFTMGTNQVRLGDLALSCSEPVRLPSSVVLAIPKGAPVIVGGPPAIDWMSGALGFFRTKSVANQLHGLVSRLKSQRLRNFLHKGACLLTGHPVDVATGRVMTSAMDVSLPGPLPLRLERNYASSWSDRDSPLGFGWSHSLDQAVWRERGRVVYRAEDGREIEFDTLALHTGLEVGTRLTNPSSGHTLEYLGGEQWRIHGRDGTSWHFSGHRHDAPAPLTAIRQRSGRSIELSYDRAGRLEWARDGDGRWVHFVHDRAGRLIRVELPHPSEDGLIAHTRYSYDEHGDLVAVTDALGHVTRYSYENHLLVRETDRTGFSFYFGYDGVGAQAYCVRTWGDDGVLDRQLDYDKRKRVTVVTDSLGQSTVHEFNLANLPVARLDALGGRWSWSYDERLLLVSEEVDPLGQRTRYEYDAAGNCIATQQPDGTRLELCYDSRNRRVAALDGRGGEWRWTWSDDDQLASETDPLGHTVSFGSAGGRLCRIVTASGRSAEITYDLALATRVCRWSDGSWERVSFDRRGRPLEVATEAGLVARYRWDLLGSLIEEQRGDGLVTQMRYDAEGYLVEQRMPVGTDHEPNCVRLGYTGFHWLSEREDPQGHTRYAYDSEGRLATLTDAAGRCTRWQRDARGATIACTDIAGRHHQFERDAAGRVVAAIRPSGQRVEFELDGLGRRLVERFHDGSERRFEWDGHGALVAAHSQDHELRFERDRLGRVVREQQAEHHVEGHWRGDARVALRTSLGFELSHDVDAAGVPTGITGRSGEAQWEARLFATEDPEVSGLRFANGVDLLAKTDAAGYRSLLDMHDRDGRRVMWTEWDGRRRVAKQGDSRAPTRHYERDAQGLPIAEHTPTRGWSVHRGDAGGRAHASLAGDERAFSAAGALQRLGDTRYEYDDDGQLLRRVTGDEAWEFEWAATGELVAVTRPDGVRSEFEYDALGRRIAKRTPLGTVRYLWDGTNMIQELGERRRDDVVAWIYLPDTSILLGRLADASSATIVTEANGAPVAVHDQRGSELWAGHVDLWGEAQPPAPPELPWRFQGQYADSETGLSYNRFRYYDPGGGCYLSPDPLGPFGNRSLYGYVDDPVSESDPLGLGKCEDFIDPPKNVAVIKLSNSHAAITVLTEKGVQTSHLLLDIADASVWGRLLQRAYKQGPSVYNGQGVKVQSQLEGFFPTRELVVFFESPEHALAALKAQRAMLGTGGTFKLGKRSCVTHVEDVLQAGNISSSHGYMTHPNSKQSFASYLEDTLFAVERWW